MNPSKPRPAKWLEAETGELPPIAFVVPLPDAEVQLVESAPSGKVGENWVTDWATANFKSRYAGALTRFEEEMKVTRDQVDQAQARIERCRKEFASTVPVILSRRTRIEFPDGFQGCWLVFLCLTLSLLILLEWWNAASFARFELQDMKAALAFTFSLALAPIALKLFVNEASAWKRLLLLSLSCGALFGFVHLFTDSYVPAGPNLSPEQLLDQIGQAPTSLLPFWQEPFHPRWRFMWQTITSILIGLALSNELVRHVNIITKNEETENPSYLRLESHLKSLIAERDQLGKGHAEAEGNIREWEASLERHVLRCLALFQVEEIRRRDEQALESFLKNKAERRSNRSINHQN
jgi:hypothetical protein